MRAVAGQIGNSYWPFAGQRGWYRLCNRMNLMQLFGTGDGLSAVGILNEGGSVAEKDAAWELRRKTIILPEDDAVVSPMVCPTDCRRSGLPSFCRAVGVAICTAMQGMRALRPRNRRCPV